MLKEPGGLAGTLYGYSCGGYVQSAVASALSLVCDVKEPGGLAGTLCAYSCERFVQLAVALALSLVCFGDLWMVRVLRSVFLFRRVLWVADSFLTA